MTLNLTNIISAINSYGYNFTGGSLGEYLRDLYIERHGNVYYVCVKVNGDRVVIGGNYVSNGKPRLFENENLDFS